MSMSIDAEKILDEIQLPFRIKTTRKIGIEGNFCQTPKANILTYFNDG